MKTSRFRLSSWRLGLTVLLVTGAALSSCGRTGHRGEDDHPPSHPGNDDDAAPPMAVNDAVTHYRGYVLIETLLRERLIADEHGTFALHAYLGGGNPRAWMELLGQANGNGMRSGFQNGDPNAFNVVLWHLALGNLADDLARQCESRAQGEGTQESDVLVMRSLAKPNAALRAALAPLCRWPEEPSQHFMAFATLMDVVMADDAPPTEREALADYFTRELDPALAPHEVVSATLGTLFMNPHFLLRK